MSAPMTWKLEPVEMRPAAPVVVPPRPWTVVGAVALMVVGAVSEAINGALSFAALDRAEVLQRLDRADIQPGNVEGFVVIARGMVLVVSAVAIGLWILTAVATTRGRAWARTLSTVLGVVFLVPTLVLLGQPRSTANAAFASGKVVLVAVVLALLWLPVSTAFFKDAAKGR